MSNALAHMAVALTWFAVLHGPAAAVDLSIGDHAPPLAVGRWIMGEPIQRLEPGRIYVVEFSATYCGTCIEYDGALALINRAIAGLSPPDEALIAWRRNIDVQLKCHKLNEEIDRDLKRGDRVAARAAIDRAISAAPEYRAEFQGKKIWFLIRIGEKPEACDEIESMIKSAAAKEDGEEVFEIVDDLLVPDFPDLGERGRAIVLRGARILNDMAKGEDPACLDLLARGYFLNGQAVQARRYEEKAVALPGGDGPEFVKRLEQYRKAVEKQKKP
jgi:tetratricopeptide (TPR) repeat protein